MSIRMCENKFSYPPNLYNTFFAFKNKKYIHKLELCRLAKNKYYIEIEIQKDHIRKVSNKKTYGQCKKGGTLDLIYPQILGTPVQIKVSSSYKD